MSHCEDGRLRKSRANSQSQIRPFFFGESWKGNSLKLHFLTSLSTVLSILRFVMHKVGSLVVTVVGYCRWFRPPCYSPPLSRSRVFDPIRSSSILVKHPTDSPGLRCPQYTGDGPYNSFCFILHFYGTDDRRVEVRRQSLKEIGLDGPSVSRSLGLFTSRDVSCRLVRSHPSPRPSFICSQTVSQVSRTREGGWAKTSFDSTGGGQDLLRTRKD